MLTPKHAHGDTSQGGVKRFVATKEGVQEGHAAAKGKKAVSNWGEGNIDPDQLARHNANIRRFHFMDRGVKPPVGPVWN